MSITDDLIDYSRLTETLLDSHDTEHGRIEIREQNNYRWIQTGDKSIQSAMHLDKPSEIVLPVYDCMLSVLLLTSNPESVLNLGFGAGAFERCFWSYLPHVNVTSVDANEVVVDYARHYFNVPAEWPVEIQLAEVYLRKTEHTFDIVICDIFFSDSETPDSLTEASFYSDLYRALTMEGTAVINLASISEQGLIDILQIIRRYFTWVTISLVPDHRNAILFLSKQPPPTKEEMAYRIDYCLKQYKLDLTEPSSSMQHLPVPLA